MNIRKKISRDFVFFDGAMGTALIDKKINVNVNNVFENEKEILEIHKEYLKIPVDIITTNTFNINKFNCTNVNATIEKAISIAKKAIKSVNNEKKQYIALGIGPLAKLLEPIGDMSFDECYAAYKEIVLAAKNDCDLILFETFSDLYEAKIAVLAAKENSDLPIIMSMTYEENQRLLTAGTIEAQLALLEGLSVDAIGLNCGFGPKQMLPLVEKLSKISSTPILIQANAGIPEIIDGKTVYNITCDDFADDMLKMIDYGVSILGGCCGTKVEDIKKMIEKIKDKKFKKIKSKNFSIISSNTDALIIEDKCYIVGERINPSGKKEREDALRDENYEYFEKEAIMQEKAGASILDINVGLADIDEVKSMKAVVLAVQNASNLPIQIDSSNSAAIEIALRYCKGKAIINSTNADKKVMDDIFPLAKKYGAIVLGLCLDEKGLAISAEDRFKLASKIAKHAKLYKIDKKNIIIDPLVLTVSTHQKEVFETFKAMQMIKKHLGLKIALGVSNISFGLPNRVLINKTFFTMAMQNGLNLAIIDPLSKEMMDSYRAYNLLANIDIDAENYIEKYKDNKKDKVLIYEERLELFNMIVEGLSDEVAKETKILLNKMDSLEIINNILVKALDKIGEDFENGDIFLPQLIKSSDAAKIAFKTIENELKLSGIKSSKKLKVLILTVFGDIHDIGKNIVKSLLENYSYQIIDLGKNVEINKVVEAVKQENPDILSLSALMTTTVKNMEKTIHEVRKISNCKIVVGGAVLSQKLADEIGADFYGKNAMDTVNYLEKIYFKTK